MGSMLPQAQAWASYNPLLGGHSRSIPQGMVQGGGGFVGDNFVGNFCLEGRWRNFPWN